MRRTMLVGCLSAALALVPAVATAGPDQSSERGRPRFSPGAPGIGDPYYPLDGNGGYDVRRYELDLAYDPATDVLAGAATIEARATQDLSSFNLDFEGLTVRSITVEGRPATWARNGGELTVTPRRGLRDRTRFTTVVTYDGVPQRIEDVFGVSGFFHTDDGALVVGQPDVAATWFPANDHPLDTASFDFRITAPAGLQVLANGELRGSRTRGDTTTWSWRAREPMAPYLAMMAIGDFQVDAYRVAGIRYWDAIDPNLAPEVQEVARGSLARQPEIVDFLESLFGRYPFSSSGGILDDEPDLFFALETQTRPIYSEYFFDDPRNGDSVVVHELAHQWVGDDVALAGWQHIWLNEGFAQYAEWLWSEREGLETAQELFDAYVGLFGPDDPFWTVPIADPGPEGIFDGAVYLRGAMTLHQLRLTVGDDAFFRILRTWTREQSGENVTTDDFVALAERVSGQQLDEFFQAWLFTPSKPQQAAPAAAAAASRAAPDALPAPLTPLSLQRRGGG